MRLSVWRAKGGRWGRGPLSQEHAARLLHVSKTVVQRIEAGEIKHCTYLTLEKVAAGLRISVERLLEDNKKEDDGDQTVSDKA